MLMSYFLELSPPTVKPPKLYETVAIHTTWSRDEQGNNSSLVELDSLASLYGAIQNVSCSPRKHWYPGCRTTLQISRPGLCWMCESTPTVNIASWQWTWQTNGDVCFYKGLKRFSFSCWQWIAGCVCFACVNLFEKWHRKVTVNISPMERFNGLTRLYSLKGLVSVNSQRRAAWQGSWPDITGHSWVCPGF